MNQPLENSSDPQAIRSQIDQTRQRMDQTIDALGERLKPRHLADEAIGFFRNQTQNGNMTKFKDKLSSSADSAVHTVVDTVKANPIPAALVAAGVAWYIYSRNRGDNSGGEGDFSQYRYRGYYDEPYGGSAGGGSDVGQRADGGAEDMGERFREKAGEVRERSKEMVQNVGERVSEMGERVRDKAQQVGERVRDKAQEVGERSREVYQQTRQRVSSAIDQHPLETGLVCLALGLIAGVSLPTSRRLRRTVAPQARQLKARTREMMEKGRVVVRSATDAAKHEAEAQGLTAGGKPESGGRPGGSSGGQGQDDLLRQAGAQQAAGTMPAVSGAAPR